jgi:opacity protein-like surface antigen
LDADYAHAQGYFWQSAQKKTHLNYFSVDGGLGMRMYSGDIQQKGGLFNPLRLAYGLGLRYQYRPRLGFALHAAGRGYAGKAEHGGFPDAMDQMTGKLWEGCFMVQYSWLKWEDFSQHMFTDRDPVTKANLFIGLGVGGAMFSSSYTSRVYTTFTVQDSAGRDSTIFTPIDRAGAGAGFALQVPIAAGFRYRFNPAVHLAFELHYQLYFSDNLDGLVRKRNDGMTLFMVKLGYQFKQTKKKGVMGLTPRQRRQLKK